MPGSVQNNNPLGSKKILELIHTSGLVDLKHLGTVVDKVTPGLRDSGAASGDYICKLVESVVQVWNTTGPLKPSLETIGELTEIGQKAPT
jgi:hypothetical protein